MKRTWTIIGVRDVSASTGTSRCSASLRRLQPMPTLGKFSTRIELSCFERSPKERPILLQVKQCRWAIGATPPRVLDGCRNQRGWSR